MNRKEYKEGGKETGDETSTFENKHLRINVTKDVHNLCRVKHKILLKEIKDLKNGKIDTMFMNWKTQIL